MRHLFLNLWKLVRGRGHLLRASILLKSGQTIVIDTTKLEWTQMKTDGSFSKLTWACEGDNLLQAIDPSQVVAIVTHPYI